MKHGTYRAFISHTTNAQSSLKAPRDVNEGRTRTLAEPIGGQPWLADLDRCLDIIFYEDGREILQVIVEENGLGSSTYLIITEPIAQAAKPDQGRSIKEIMERPVTIPEKDWPKTP